MTADPNPSPKLAPVTVRLSGLVPDPGFTIVGPKMTVSFPEERPVVGNPLIYRGVHRLNKDEQGRVKAFRDLVHFALDGEE